MKTITIILPAYNEADSMAELKTCMEKVLADNINYAWEFLIVNDGSNDDTLLLTQQLCNEDKHYHYIDLSRNYGKEIAIMAGLDYAQGDAVIIMDADMQHPIDIIPKMAMCACKAGMKGRFDVAAITYLGKHIFKHLFTFFHFSGTSCIKII